MAQSFASGGSAILSSPVDARDGPVMISRMLFYVPKLLVNTAHFHAPFTEN
jgi:hypothetical protein